MKITRVAVVLDSSGSMSSLWGQVQKSYYDLMQQLGRAIDQDHRVEVTAYSFSTEIRRCCAAVTPSKASEFVLPFLNNSTALFDAVVQAIDDLNNQPRTAVIDYAHLVIVLTDGEENASIRHNGAGTAQVIERHQRQGNWTIALQVPPGRRKDTARRLGIPEDNVREWEATYQGTVETFTATASAVDTYMDLRKKAGQRASSNFYAPAVTNASQITQKDLSKLQDVRSQFKSYTADKESIVKEFVTQKTGNYVIGGAYYQLMKPEKVQPDKQVLLLKKDTKQLFGGDDARSLIGIPQGVHSRVTPGNHADFDIFVQSRSVNRKLPRGTKVLVDVKHVKDDNATWVPIDAKCQTP